jgi:hypothetical protein
VSELLLLLPIAAFVGLAALTLIVLRRAGKIVAQSRDLEGFRSGVHDLAGRVDSSLGGAIGRIDAVRRGQVAADTIGPTIEAATDAVERYAEEARALHGPKEALPIRDDIVEELERAGRALAMVEHGATILAQVRRRGRELEAQTSLKRGYLNLLHAKEAIDRHALRVDTLQLTAEADGTTPTVTVREPRS